MFQGYYNLASGMLTQNRNLNVVSNNMANILTPGYKRDVMYSSTFQEELISRTGNLEHKNATMLNDVSMKRVATETASDFTQGALEQTESPLDFALLGEGFFQIQTENGIRYTRNGSFIIDDAGYLSLPEVGRVIGENGPIYLGTDDIHMDPSGMLYRNDQVPLGRFALVTFADQSQLVKAGKGIFRSDAAGIPSNVNIQQKTLERSNVDAGREIVAMMESQRALQSASQILKIYDQLAGKASTELARV